jgi:hypothetical protein
MLEQVHRKSIKNIISFFGVKNTPITRIVEKDELPKCSVPGCDKEAEYDDKTIYGPWAYLCSEHQKKMGMNVGTKLVKRRKVAAKKTNKVLVVHIPLDEGLLDSCVEVQCPHCGCTRTVEPDANYTVECDNCENKYRVSSPI